jgi:hypothetical protein
MAAKLRDRKTKNKFETSIIYRGKPLIVEADPYVAKVRQKGCKFEVSVPWDVIYESGMRLKYLQDKKAEGGG